MSAASLPPFPTTAEALPRKRFTRDEVERYVEAGFFDGQRFEIIDGDLLDKMGQKPPHAMGIRLIQAWLTKMGQNPPNAMGIGLTRVCLQRILGGDRVQSQLPIETAGADRERSLPE